MARTYGETLELVGKLAAAGLTDAEIGKAIDLAPASVKEVRELVGKAIGLLEGDAAPKRCGRRSDSRRRAVLDLHDRGFGIDEAAIRLGVSAKTVARHLREAEVVSVPAKVPETAQTDDAVRRRSGRTQAETVALVGKLARSGVPDEAIAEALGLKVRTVQGYKWRAGIVLPSRVPDTAPKGRPVSRRQEVAELALQGLADREIAAATGLMLGTVATYRMFMGIQRRKRPVPESGARLASVELSRQGLTDEEVAERTGLAVGTVGVYRAAAGVPKASVRKPVPPPPR